MSQTLQLSEAFAKNLPTIITVAATLCGVCMGQFLSHRNNKTLKKNEISLGKTEAAYVDIQNFVVTFASHSGLIELLLQGDTPDVRDLFIEMQKYEDTIWKLLSSIDMYVYLYAEEFSSKWGAIGEKYREYNNSVIHLKYAKSNGEDVSSFANLMLHLELENHLLTLLSDMQCKHEGILNRL